MSLKAAIMNISSPAMNHTGQQVGTRGLGCIMGEKNFNEL
jgi:hypothetical protein